MAMTAIPTILKGDTPKPVKVTAPAKLATLYARYQGVERTWTDVAEGDTLAFQLTAAETARLALGSWPIAFVGVAADGSVTSYPLTARIKVTDCPGEVLDAAVEIEGGASAEPLKGETVETGTVSKMREAVKRIAEALGATATALALCAAPFGARGAEVAKAPLGDLDLDANPQVVTNVTFEGLATTDDVSGAKTYADHQVKNATAAAKVQIGSGAKALTGGVAVGMNSYATNYAVAVGYGAKANAANETTVGNTAVSHGANTLNLPSLSLSDIYLGVKLLQTELDERYETSTHAGTTYPTKNAMNSAVGKAAVAATNYTDAALAGYATTKALAATEAEVNSVWGYMKGETFRVVVTNYDSAVNPPRTRYDYRMSTSNEWRTVWAETNGLNWAVSEATKLAAVATAAEIAKPENRAWGGWDSHTGLPAPDGVVQVSGGGGLLIGSESGWTQINATGGSYWVLTSTDPTLRANGTNGVFQITDPDGKSVMTIRKGDKRLVYADASGITTAEKSITVKYDIISEKAPKAECAVALAGTWYEQGESGAPFAFAWSGSSGAWVLTVTAPSGGTLPTTGFFRALFETGGGTEVVYDAAIGLTTVSIGGKQYTVGTATVTDASGNTKTVLTLE